MITKARVSLEEFLAMPETEPPSELIDGEVVQKMAPSLYHGILTAELIRLLGTYLHDSREGRVVNEVRHVQPGEQRVFLPDVNVTLKQQIPQGRRVRTVGPIPIPPDLAVEVVSPGESIGRVLERADFYMRSGTRLLWIIDPETETITAYHPGEPPSVHRAPAVINAQPVLRAFQLDLAALFAVLHEDEDDGA